MYHDHHIWNITFTLLFAGVVVFLSGVLIRLGRFPTDIALFDALLVLGATFRLIRLVVYDKILLWFRDLFMRVDIRMGDMGESVVVRQEYPSGPLRTISELLACPWCFGIWAAFFVSFAYFATPLAWYPIFALALAGAATLLQLLANFIGWSAEKKKQETQRMK